MNQDYPDYIFFKRMDRVVNGHCQILNIHDGLITFIFANDKTEHTIPAKSLIDLQRSKRRGEDYEKS